jgi:glycosyltransferase involved in cell wall biosynthesis
VSTLLTINNYFYPRGGSETIFFEHNRLFQNLGWEVVPFSMQHPGNLSSPWSKYFIDDLEMHGDYSLLEKLRRVPKVIYSFEARQRLGQLLEQVTPDIAHGHNIYHHISPSILGLLKQRGIPTVLTLHDLKIACPAYNMLTRDGVCERCKGGRIYNVVTNRCIGGSAMMSLVVGIEALVHKVLGSYSRCVDLFVVPSRFYVEKFCEWGMPRKLFRHIPNFVDLGNFRPEYAPGGYFLYFGRVIRHKGVTTLIRAAARSGVRLQIAGTGPELEECRALASELGANVIFRGHLSGTELHDTIRAARAVVLPSEWYENAPVSVLEAYAMGKPVIGARIGGIPELIRDGDTGLSFSSGDVANLAAVLADFSSRRDSELEAMGRSGRQWVAQDFTAEMYQQRMLAAYRELGVPERIVVPETLGAPS